jgi:pimeloyl-ACP methyl ester carboxylesterase
LELARKAMRLNQEGKVNLPLGPSELATLLVALESALEHLEATLREGDMDAPANPRAPQRVVALRALRPDADVRMIPGAGHWVAYEAPEQFNAMLLEMLKRTRP